MTLTNSYDERGNRDSLIASFGGTWGFSQDLTGLDTTITPPTGGPLTIAYRETGQLAGLGYPNGTSGVNGFDPLTGRLATLSYQLGGTPFVDNQYDYDAAGNVAEIVGLTGTNTYQYDLLEQVIGASSPSGAESYAYDGEGNRTTSHLSSSHVVNAANRLLEDDAFCYGYDANGNQTSKTAKVSGVCSGGVTTYTYNTGNELARIDFPGGGFAAYLYDAFGRRIEKDVDGTITRFLYDRLNVIAEFDDLGNLIARYSHGPYFDQPLEMERGGQNYYFHADQLGSIVAVTDSLGTVVNQYAYDAYGNFLQQSETVANPYGFTGRVYDPESELYYYRARYYDPAIGRFISEDPLNYGAADTNFYRYVRNNPANLKDPLGLSPFSEEAGAAAVAARSTPGLIALGAALRTTFNYLAEALTAVAAVAIADAIDGDCDLCGAPGISTSSGGAGAGGGGGSAGGGGEDGSSGDNGGSPGMGHNKPPPDNPWPIAIPPDWFTDTDWPGWSPGKINDPWANAANHYYDHYKEFPELNSVDDYVKAANEFISNPPDGTLVRYRPDGDTWYYFQPTNTFAISTPGGVPRTMFRPDTGIAYFYQ